MRLIWETLAGWLLLAMAALPMCAQTVAEAPVPDAPTLHVYVNLMQIPVLVLDQYHRPLPPIPTSRFKVDIEGMKPFTPVKVRQQGDDPISLAILLDHSDADEDLWERLPEASRALAAMLRPHDRVEVYGMDGCKLRRYLNETPFDAESLHTSLVNAAADKPYVTMRKKVGPCAKPVGLGEALLYVASVLEQRKGRRILLALSDGRGGISTETGTRLHELMNFDSTTLFAIQHGDGDSGYFAMMQGFSHMQSTGRGRGSSVVNMIEQAPEAALQTESELSGGMMLAASLHSLPKVLARTIELVRERYLVEFSRPAEFRGGEHRNIVVSAGDRRQFIRPAGIGVPIATKEELAVDPTVEHGVSAPLPPAQADAAQAPVAEPLATPPAVVPPAPSVPPTPQMVAPPQQVSAPKPAPERDPLDITDDAKPAMPVHAPTRP